MEILLWLLSQVPAPSPAPPAPGISKEIVAVVAAAVVTIIGSLTAAIVSVITTLRTKTKVVEAAAEAQVRGKSQDRQLRKIHLLTNSRLAAALKLLARMTKKEADRTKDPEDVAAYEEARRELESANIGTMAVEIEEEAEVREAKEAEE